MSHVGVMDEELAFVAESHAPIMSGTPTLDVMDTSDSDYHPIHQPKIPARSKLRVNILSTPPPPPPLPPTVTSSIGISPSSTSESDGDGTQSDRVTSLPSFHLPNRTRASATYYRDRAPETPPLTSPSHSSLNSNSAISQVSALCTPPHSPPAQSFVFTESTTPNSHLSVISEGSTVEDPSVHRISHRSAPSKGTQAFLLPFARTDRPSSSSSAQSENEGQVVITPRSVPRRLDAHVYLSETHSPTGTVTNVLLNAAVATTSPSLADFPTPTAAAATAAISLSPPQLPSTPESPSHSSFSTQSSGSPGIISWPFANNNSSNNISNKSKTTIVAPPPTKAQKAQEKNRKKEEARARRDRLARELRSRTDAQRARADNASAYTSKSAEKQPWEGDIAIFGGLI